jgi:serine/threonine protein kinase
MEHDWLIGKQLGAYRIQSKLGEGGMAQVYKAYHERLHREVAIKVILSQYASQADYRARFEHEARAIAKLHHRNIVAVYDFWEVGNVTYLAMQYVSGGTLRDPLRSRQPLEPQLAALYALQIARALHHAHSHGIIHRDVKPENVLISSTNSNELLLSDFGLAKLFEERQKAAFQSSMSTSRENESLLSHNGQVLGTPYYMAPEQIRGQAVDARTDVYALGVVLFEMLTGERPFQADNRLALYYQHVYTLPKPVREINTAVPMALEQITARALAKAPEDRYQSADEMAQALKTMLAPPPSTSRLLVAPAHPRYKVLFQRLLRPTSIATIIITILIIVQFLIKLGILHWHGIGIP